MNSLRLTRNCMRLAVFVCVLTQDLHTSSLLIDQSTMSLPLSFFLYASTRMCGRLHSSWLHQCL